MPAGAPRRGRSPLPRACRPSGGDPDRSGRPARSPCSRTPGRRLRSPRGRAPPTRSARIRAGPRVYSREPTTVTAPAVRRPSRSQRRASWSRPRAATARSPPSSAISPSAAAASRPATRSSRDRSCTELRAGAPTSTARRPESSRGPEGAPVARSRGQGAAALARARRGDLLRDLLLRLGDPLLPRAEPGRARRPHAHACRRRSARRGARRSCDSSGPSSSSRSAASQPPRSPRRPAPHRMRRQELPPRRARS